MVRAGSRRFRGGKGRASMESRGTNWNDAAVVAGRPRVAVARNLRRQLVRNSTAERRLCSVARGESTKRH